MTVDELIAALRLCSGSSDVVMETAPPKPKGDGDGEGIIGETSPVLFAGTDPADPHALTLIAARVVEILPPPEPAPLDPGYPGQLSPPPYAETQPVADEEAEYPQPLKAPKVTKK